MDILELKQKTDAELEQMIRDANDQIAAIHESTAVLHREVSVRAQKVKYKAMLDGLSNEERRALQQYITDSGAVVSSETVPIPGAGN